MGEIGQSGTRRIVIALDAGFSEPRGHLEVDGETGWPFTGWLGLLTSLQSVTEEQPVTADAHSADAGQ